MPMFRPAAASAGALARGLALVICTIGTIGMPASSQPAPPARTIYTCTDASGKKLTSDRPIPECAGREQRVLNADGSFRRALPPTPTTEERNQAEAREREAAEAREARREAVRRDRNLLARYPNEAAHRKAREAALDNPRNALRSAEARLEILAGERKPLLAEAEFYVGKPLPVALKAQLEANDVSVEAQRVLIQNQQADVARIDKAYDAELERMRRLWGGAPPGSLGEPQAAASAAPATASAPRRK